MALDDLVHLRRAAADEPVGVLVLMHGRGVDESDLFPLLDLFDPDRALAAFTPRAPLRLPGQPGNHWYAVERVGFPHRETFHATHELLGSWLESVADETGLGIERTVVGGFSQGAVMSFALGLGRGRPQPAGILALSGFVPTVDGWDPDLESRPALPVYVTHGTTDPVIPVEFGRRARDLLEGGVALTYSEHPGGHTIDPRSFDEMRAWLRATVRSAGDADGPSAP